MKYLLLILLIACAPKKDDPAAIVPPKDLASAWVSDSPSWKVTLNNLHADKSIYAEWTYGPGGKCQSDLVITKTNETTGTLSMSNTLATEVVSGMANCSMFDGTWTYDLTNGSLILCQLGQHPCVSFN